MEWYFLQRISFNNFLIKSNQVKDNLVLINKISLKKNQYNKTFYNDHENEVVGSWTTLSAKDWKGFSMLVL